MEHDAAYSSTNIIVMELIAETVTGKTMTESVDTLVIQPLGLNHTALPLRTAPPPVRPEPAAGTYVRGGCVQEFADVAANIVVGTDTTPIDEALVVVGTAGSMYSTIQDLLRWASSGTGDTLLTPKSIAIRHDRADMVSVLWRRPVHF